MKKNLRIVSAAAAALLAVAPVAATAVVSNGSVVSATETNQQTGKKVVVTTTTTIYSDKKGTTVSAADSPVKENTVVTLGKKAELKIGDNTVTGYEVNFKGSGNTYYVVASTGVTGVNAVSPLAQFDQSLSLVKLPGTNSNFIKGLPEGATVTKPGKNQSVTNFKDNNIDTSKITNLPKLEVTSLDGSTTTNIPGKPGDAMIYNKNNQKKTTGDITEDDSVVIPVSYTAPADQTVYVDLGDGNGLVELPRTLYYIASVNGSTNSTTPSKPGNNNGSTTTPVTGNKPSESINAGNKDIYGEGVNTTATVNAVAANKKANTPSVVSGSVVATVEGQSYTALLHGEPNTTVYNYNKGNYATATQVDSSKLTAGHYWAKLNDVTVNLGNSQAGKKVKFTLSRGVFLDNNKKTLEVTVSPNGVAHLNNIMVDFFAYDADKTQGIHFYDVKTGDVVTNGSVNMHAVNGMVSVQALYAALTEKYGASQYKGAQGYETLNTVNDLKAQLEKANIKVNEQGYFKAPASFSINMNAKSNLNGATAQLPVTITVDNAAAETPAQETTKTVTIMHISTIYDKKGNATHDAALRAYDKYSVVAEPVTINGAKFYKLAGKDQYIKVGNVDGTSRSLKHNSYIYKSNGKAYTKKVGKKAKKTVKKAGSSVTTYGKSFMIAGHQMYRIGHNQYIKKANF